MSETLPITNDCFASTVVQNLEYKVLPESSRGASIFAHVDGSVVPRPNDNLQPYHIVQFVVI
jgi:hypothetical protein